jgi:hypothetical protein
MSKILVQIDTFIRGKYSEEITIECINRIKELGFPILLTSHLEIPDEISSMCDYCEVDLNNPLLEPDGSMSFLTFGTNSFSTSIVLNNPDPHAPACLTSLINGARFSHNNGFDFFVRFEYDSVLKKEYISHLKTIIETGSMCKGMVFSGKNWIDGKIIMCKSNDYINCFDKQINTGDDYMRFVTDEGIPNHDKRHLQCVQYQILEKNQILNYMIQLPTHTVGLFLDNDFTKSRSRNIGIFRPAFIENDSSKFAIICHGWEIDIDIEFQIFKNDIPESFSHYFISNGVTYKIFDIIPETLYKLIYINPITGNKEKWEFSSSSELKNIAKLELR